MTPVIASIKRLFVPARLDEIPSGTKLIAYALLGLWSLVVLFPLYWMAITSFKLPIDVSNGPAYLPFIDFKPSLDAWRYIFVDLGPDTFRPYVNSLIVATCSTVAAVFLGSMAAYALARIQYRPPRCRSGRGRAAARGVDRGGRLGRRRSADCGGSVRRAVLPAVEAGDTPRAPAPGQRRHPCSGSCRKRILPPVVTVIPVYLTFKTVGLLDTHLALIITYATSNVPIVVWLMFDFFTGVPKEIEGKRADRRRDAFFDPVRHRVSARRAGGSSRTVCWC